MEEEGKEAAPIQFSEVESVRQQSDFAPIRNDDDSELRDSYDARMTRVENTLRIDEDGNFVKAKPLSGIKSESKIYKSKQLFDQEEEKNIKTPSASRRIDLSSGVKQAGRKNRRSSNMQNIVTVDEKRIIREGSNEVSSDILPSPGIRNLEMTQDFTPVEVGPESVMGNTNVLGISRAPEPKFLNCFTLASSCCCGCVSLKHATVFFCVFDLTLGLASAGIVFMVIEEKLEPSSFLAIVFMNIIAMILAIPSLINVLKTILPGVKSKAFAAYTILKVSEILICPILDISALWASTSFSSKESAKTEITHGEIEKELYNEEVYEDDYLPIINMISFQVFVVATLVLWIPFRVFIVYILYSYS